jgi:hypothetical protein
MSALFNPRQGHALSFKKGGVQKQYHPFGLAPNHGRTLNLRLNYASSYTKPGDAASFRACFAVLALHENSADAYPLGARLLPVRHAFYAFPSLLSCSNNSFLFAFFVIFLYGLCVFAFKKSLLLDKISSNPIPLFSLLIQNPKLVPGPDPGSKIAGAFLDSLRRLW